MADAPQSTAAPNTLRFYFSFRSPYSWLAMHRCDTAFANTGLDVELIPVFPPPNYENDPARFPAKLAYIRHDVARQARAYGLPCKFPTVLDCEWVRPHAAFLYALDHGGGRKFADAAYHARFGEGLDLGQPEVIAQCARAAGIDPASAVAAQDEKALQERVVLGMIRGAVEDGIFGVPLFVFRGERFWGNDRIEWVLRHVAELAGQPITDLKSAPLAPVHR